MNKKNILLFFLLCCFAISGFAQSQGPNNPQYATEQAAGCLACPGTDWNYPDSAELNDGNNATTGLMGASYCFQSTCYFSRGLLVSDYGFTIPTAATILGIKVEVKRNAANLNSILDSIVQLLYGNNGVGDNKASSLAWDTASNYFVYGSNTDLWGFAWTPNIINTTSFGAMVKIKNLSNTQQDAFVDHIRITVYYSLTAPPDASFSLNDSTVCPCTAVQFTDLSQNIPTSWLWSFPNGNPDTSTLQNPIITYCTPGNYGVTLIATNSYGADTVTLTAIVNVSFPSSPAVTFSNDTLFCTGASGLTYQWYLDSTMLIGATNNYFVPSSGGNYYVVITDSSNCPFSSANFFWAPNGINEINKHESVFLFPNPAFGILTIENKNNSSTNFTICNSLGMVLKNIKSVKEKKTIDVSNFSSGVYYIKLISSDGVTVVKKFVVVH